MDTVFSPLEHACPEAPGPALDGPTADETVVLLREHPGDQGGLGAADRQSAALDQGSARRFLRPAIIGATLVLMAVLIFARLGMYAFWDDEAGTALSARAIMLTGKNTALIDHGNIVAYRNGNALHGFDNLIEPLLPSYLTAATFEVLGANTWAGRFPFALFGLGTAALVMFWVRREPWPVVAVFAIGLLGNVPLILYSRNCRYYAPAIFFSVALAYLYRCGKPTRARTAAFVALSILLFTTNYLNYVAFYVCLSVDYFFWQRKHSPLSWRMLAGVFLPQVIVNGAVATIWNPLRTAHAANLVNNTLWDRSTLLYWQWRDTNLCEQICVPLFLLACVVGLVRRRALLVRGCVALIVYVVLITTVSPQLVSESTSADVRYLTPLIPLALGVEAAALCVLLRRWPLILLGTAVVAFCTNFAFGAFLFPNGNRSTLVSYVHELTNPPAEPYGPTAAWINANVPEGKSIWVMPGYAAYPLMFHAPKALYAWQLDWPTRPEYADLPPIHFKGRVAPDYLIGFGPYTYKMEVTIAHLNHPELTYEEVAMINVYWWNLDRPELFWHCFEPVSSFRPEWEAIHIFRHVDAPTTKD